MTVVKSIFGAILICGVAFLFSSCGKNDTPADKIDEGTVGMEKKIETLKKEVQEKEAEAEKNSAQ